MYKSHFEEAENKILIEVAIEETRAHKKWKWIVKHRLIDLRYATHMNMHKADFCFASLHKSKQSDDSMVMLFPMQKFAYMSFRFIVRARALTNEKCIRQHRHSKQDKCAVEPPATVLNLSMCQVKPYAIFRGTRLNSVLSIDGETMNEVWWARKQLAAL